MQLLVRNKVKDFSTWYRYFAADSTAAAELGVKSGVIDGEVHFLDAVQF